MTDRELERRLSQAVSRAAPDDLDAVLARCGGRNRSVMGMDAQDTVGLDLIGGAPRRKRGRTWLAAACAALVLLGAGGGFGWWYQNAAVASVVSLDVNPSIELKINRGERVISCTPLNQEAAAVLFSMDGGAGLKGAKLELAVNAVLGALVKAGYLDSVSSAILISVEDRDQDRAARLQRELAASVDGALQDQAPGACVYSQVLPGDASAPAGAASQGISAGKAALVRRVMERCGSTDFDRLAALSVEELEDLLETGEARIPIGKSAAALAAEEHAGTLALDSVTADVDPELDEVPPHYEVELVTAWGEFDYIVDAFTGQVLRGQRDLLSLAPGGDGPEGSAAPQPAPSAPAPATPAPPAAPAPTPTPAPAASQDAGQDAAVQAALRQAGLDRSQITGLQVERGWDDGRLEYEIEFWCGGTQYDYTIDGRTCSVLEHQVEHQGGHHQGGSAPAADIGAQAAKAAALAHAGVDAGQVTGLQVERGWDDGRLEYDLEFQAGGLEYEYTIDGATGAVLSCDRD